MAKEINNIKDRGYKVEVIPMPENPDERFVIADAATGEILDNCQGWGYKSPKTALGGYGRKQDKLFPKAKTIFILKDKSVKTKAVPVPWDHTKYMLIDEKTGEVVDNNLGQGYFSAQGAHIEYKKYQKAKEKQEEEERKERIEKEKQETYLKVKKWLLEHNSVVEAIDDELYFNIKDVDQWNVLAIDIQRIIQEAGVECPFHSTDVRRVWRKEVSRYKDILMLHDAGQFPSKEDE